MPTSEASTCTHIPVPCTARSGTCCQTAVCLTALPLQSDGRRRILRISDPLAADEELENTIQAPPHGSETSRRQPGARRATTNGARCSFPSRTPFRAQAGAPRCHLQPAAPQPCRGRPTCQCGPRRDGRDGGAGAEGEEVPQPAPSAADSGALPDCRLRGLRGRAGSGSHSPATGRSRPPRPLTDRWRRAPPARPLLPPPRGPPRLRAAPDVASPGRAA